MGILTHIKEGELHGGVFRLITGDQFIFTFVEVEGTAVRLGKGADQEYDETEGLLYDIPHPLL